MGKNSISLGQVVILFSIENSYLWTGLPSRKGSSGCKNSLSGQIEALKGNRLLFSEKFL